MTQLLKKYIATFFSALVVISTTTAGLPEIKVTPEWQEHIRQIAPAQPTVKPYTQRKILLFSLMTGFQHWVTPHTSEVIKILAEKTGAFEVIESNDIKMFAPEKIAGFDAIILNNTCSKGPGRNMFIDVLGADKKDKAASLENSLLNYVATGHGLVAIHGAITMLNSSEKFNDMLGGAFDHHPPQQEVTLTPVEPEHSLLKAFDGKPLIHTDEPYLFNGKAQDEKNFRPLLIMDTSKLTGMKKEELSEIRYTAWIKKYGNGRVFYVSPSHNAQSFDDPRLLQFYLDGIQYALGDYQCDDTPVNQKALK